MRRAERQAILALPVILSAGAAIAWAGSQGGLTAGGVPVFALCAMLSFGINWLVFVHAYTASTEHYFDLTGSLTYVSVLVLALSLVGVVDTRAILLSGMIGVWAVRLGSFLFARVRRNGGDGRFDKIKVSFVRFLMAWTVQGLWVLLNLACALAAMTSANPEPVGIFAAVGTLAWVVGFAIEVRADQEKTRFRGDPANRGRFIDSGLWAWSRHPNYFGEILLWAGVALVAFPVLVGWQHATLISPFFVYVLLTRISGISLLDANAKRVWGDDPTYQAYRQRTPALFPRPPRSG